MKFFQSIFILIGLLMLFSCKQAKLSDARNQYIKGEYYSASETYRKLYTKSREKDSLIKGVIAFEMAEVYRKLNRTSNAVNSYKNAIRFEYPDSLLYLRYAQMLHKAGEYNQAVEAYNRYLSLNPDDQIGKNGLEGAKLSLLWQKEGNKGVKIEYSELLNSNRGDFSPVLAHNDNTIYFCSSRNDATGENSPVTGYKYNDIFSASKNQLGEWQKPKRMASEINTEFEEGSLSITKNGRFMFYTQSISDLKNPSRTKIYISQRINGEWSIGKELELPSTDSSTQYLYAHPAISPSGDYLYFVSDMPGGYGGKDIWRAKLTGELEPLSIENLGPSINTSGDEVFPYLRDEETLYFSSDGHPGMGGLDIFTARKKDNSDNWNLFNIKPPLNSSYDDHGITFEKNRKKGFFSSNRDDIRGYNHIYSFEIQENRVIVEGIVVDNEDNFIEGAKVLIVGSDGIKRSFTTNRDGEYTFDANAGNNYLLMAIADRFVDLKQTLNIDHNVSDTLYFVDFEMIPLNKPVVLENLLYGFDSHIIKEESIKELDWLIDFLNEHPGLIIELKSHTDRWGDEEYNFKLSKRRALSVKEHLIKNGVDNDRVVIIAVGESEPKEVTESIASKYEFLKTGDILSEDRITKLTPEQQEIADQLNRRTEFRIIEN